MDTKAAKEIIRLLARGIDPVTGEMFPDDSPYNHPKIIRALFIAAENIHTHKAKNKKPVEEKQQENISKGRPRNAGLPWSDELKKKVADMYNLGKSVKDISQHLERTEGAIISELVRQELISPERETFS